MKRGDYGTDKSGIVFCSSTRTGIIQVALEDLCEGQDVASRSQSLGKGNLSMFIGIHPPKSRIPSAQKSPPNTVLEGVWSCREYH